MKIKYLVKSSVVFIRFQFDEFHIFLKNLVKFKLFPPFLIRNSNSTYFVLKIFRQTVVLTVFDLTIFFEESLFFHPFSI